ncbi:MAG: transcription-repair coupling factor [Deltaproteobacteria bacterium]|nr:transcription-repair coupling factor [Deltaproteobacteria bacterium]
MTFRSMEKFAHQTGNQGAGWQEALEAIATGVGRIDFYGLTPAAGAFVLARLVGTLQRPLLVLVPSSAQQEAFYRDLSFFLGQGDKENGSVSAEAPALFSFPAHEQLAFKELTMDARVSSARLETAYALTARGKAPIVVASALAALQPLPPRQRLAAAIDYVVPGEELDRERFIKQLIAGGYERSPLVEARGEYSVRGGVIDLYPPLQPYPVRLEFWGDEVESLRYFNPTSQRSLGHLVELLVLPVNEVILDPETQKYAAHRLRVFKDPKLREYVKQGRHFPEIEKYLAYFYPQPETLWDYLPDQALLVEWDPLNLAQEVRRLTEIQAQETEGSAGLAISAFEGRINRFQTIRCHSLEFSTEPGEARRSFYFAIETNQDLAAALATAAADQGRLVRPLAAHLKPWLNSGFEVVLVCRSRSQAERLGLLLADQEVKAEVTGSPGWDLPGRLQLTWNGLSAGFRSLAWGLVLLTAEEILGAEPERRPPRRSRPGQLLSSLAELKVGDLLVHLDHGIGLYRGLEKLTVGQEVNDFLRLEYLGGDKLYLPVDRLHLVQKYLGVEGLIPPLDRLGGKSWEKTKKRVRKAVEKIARELVQLYAARQVVQGHQFSPPDPVFWEFEATFEYEETPDQLQAIQEVLLDMASDKPMDRLICGDVGYGKTEVAIRAAFKAAMDGRQVAILVPTTVLAEQHYETFRKRLGPYPLQIRMLSRFKTTAEQKQILAELSSGQTDIVIGTHRLLQKDVQFRELGLVIIDEEQRFGVKQKEKLKQLRQTVDVLTLTATPIPRTLQLSLTGIRDLSTIDTAPEARRPIRTYLCRPDDTVIMEAIRRELRRGGQAFFVHNRVQNIDTWANYIRRLVPEARVAVAHGQMAAKELEQIMWRFWRGTVDVLVCTAIIEAGLDVPSANTIIINRAHALGLAQVYQLRGRVGRGREQAYAYLLVPEEEALNPEAQKRLKALMEFTELGSGFKIALHDLQIRGAGNLLGAAQSGHIAEVGCELYLQLLEQAVQELKGGPQLDEGPLPELHLPLAAYLPDAYVPDIDQRLMFYRRLSGRLSPAEIADIDAELRDCYGPLPPEAENLLEVVRTKVTLRELGIKRLDLSDSQVTISFADNGRIDLARLVDLLHRQPQRFRLTPDQQIRVHLTEGDSPLEMVKNCLKEIKIFVKGEETTPSAAEAERD